jgi:hypothetical protein
MIQFEATIQRFGKQGEKTGWTYVVIPAGQATVLQPGIRKTFRVKGSIDTLAIDQVALLPMGEGDFILPLNASMRKEIRKPVGEKVRVKLEVDKRELKPSFDLLACLQDEPQAQQKFNSLSKSHRNYFNKWIESAKTEETKAKRIADTLRFLSLGKDYGEMLRTLKKEREER